MRFSQGGHIFLVQNTYCQSYYQKNALLISDGTNDTPLPPLAEMVAATDFPTHAISITRLNDVHHTDWTRAIFWPKQGDGFFVVLDTVRMQQDGPHSVTCTWRTPAYAELDNHTWRSRQGEHRFTLRASQDWPTTNEEQEPQVGERVYALR